MLVDALTLLGLSTPFIYAGATYSVFLYLDNKASDDAKGIVAGWLKPLDFKEVNVASATVELFDRLYTQPLLGWRAFMRSAVFSIVIFFLAMYEFGLVDDFFGSFPPIEYRGEGSSIVMVALVANIVSDYLSLFVIRAWLNVADRRPVVSLFGAAAIGALVVVFIFIVRDNILAWITFGSFEMSLETLKISNLTSRHNFSMWAAVAVHFWLLLFALGILVLRLLSPLLWAAGKVQWFIKQGQFHPVEAVGYVAAALVFVTTAIARVVQG
jgi:hypothetical protein